jgi:hypothetical protein
MAGPKTVEFKRFGTGDRLPTIPLRAIEAGPQDPHYSTEGATPKSSFLCTCCYPTPISTIVDPDHRPTGWRSFPPDIAIHASRRFDRLRSCDVSHFRLNRMLLVTNFLSTILQECQPLEDATDQSCSHRMTLF